MAGAHPVLEDEAAEPSPVLTEDDVTEILNHLTDRWRYGAVPHDDHVEFVTDWQMLSSDIYALVRTIEILRHMASVTKIRGPRYKKHVMVRLDSRAGYKGDRLRWRYRYICRCGEKGSWWQPEDPNAPPVELAFGGQHGARLEFDKHQADKEKEDLQQLGLLPAE